MVSYVGNNLLIDMLLKFYRNQGFIRMSDILMFSMFQYYIEQYFENLEEDEKIHGSTIIWWLRSYKCWSRRFSNLSRNEKVSCELDIKLGEAYLKFKSKFGIIWE